MTHFYMLTCGQEIRQQMEEEYTFLKLQGKLPQRNMTPEGFINYKVSTVTDMWIQYRDLKQVHDQGFKLEPVAHVEPSI